MWPFKKKQQAPQSEEENYGMPENWVPLDVEPIIPSRSTPGQETPSDISSRFLQGSIPPAFQHDTSFVGTAYKASATPQLSLMPLGPQGDPNKNAAAQSTAGLIVATIPPVVIPPPAAAVGDGLIHGDAIWEYDSAYNILRDDFWANGATTGTIGELNWGLGGVSVSAYPYGGAFPYLGQVEISTANPNADAVTYLAPRNVTVASTVRSVWDMAWPLFDYPGWKMTWVFSIRTPDPQNGGTFHTLDLTKLSMYIGLGNGISASGVSAFTIDPRPNVFFGCRFDTDTTAPSIADTTFHLEACTNAIPVTQVRYNNQGTLGGTFDTTIAPVNGAMHRLEISYLTAGQLTITLDGVGTTFTISQLVTTWPNNTITTGAGQSLIPSSTPSAAYSNTVGHAGVGVGGLVTLAGASLPAPYIGTFPVLQDVSGQFLIKTPSGGVGGASGTFTTAAFPGVQPIASIGQDSTGAIADRWGRCLAVDYFSFVWSKGLAGATGPDLTKPRYW